jgi:hypothetical protein
MYMPQCISARPIDRSAAPEWIKLRRNLLQILGVSHGRVGDKSAQVMPSLD